MIAFVSGKITKPNIRHKIHQTKSFKKNNKLKVKLYMME